MLVYLQIHRFAARRRVTLALLAAAVSAAHGQSGPDPQQELGINVTMQTNSAGHATVTNNSATYHYKGELTCVTTCPGPGANGCSATDTVVKPVELAPGGSTGCLMLPTVDPCCLDDGDFVLSAKVNATDYRVQSSDPWTPLSQPVQKAYADIAEDAGPGSHDPVIEKVKAAHLELTMACIEPGHTVDAYVRATNNSRQTSYRVRVRGQLTCPSDIPDPICHCNYGFPYSQSLCPSDPSLDPTQIVCNADPSSNPTVNNCVPYPRMTNEAVLPEFTCALDPATQWVWCEKLLLPEQSLEIPMGDPPLLNNCCDCDQVQNSIVCGELDTRTSQKPRDASEQPVNQQNFDKTGKCRAGDNPLNKDLTCFSNVCANPI